MASVKTRAARAGVKYLVTHPRGRVTRFVVRLAVRRVSQRISTAPGVEAIPAVRGSRVTTVAGVAAVAVTIVVIVRRTSRARPATTAPTVPSPIAPFPAAAPAAPPPETRDAPPSSPTTSPASEVTAAVGDDEALVARVQAELATADDAAPVGVEATAGVVTLRGEVADQAAESRVVLAAERVEGVKAVQSELRTEPGQEDEPAS